MTQEFVTSPTCPSNEVRVTGVMTMEVSNPSIAFVLELGRALHSYGTPANRLEGALSMCAGLLGLESQFFSTPTSLFAAFGKLENQRTYLIRVQPGEVDLGKLVELDETVNALEQGRIGVEDALTRVRFIVNAPPRYGPITQTISFSVIGAGAACFFGGAWREMLTAGLIGIVVSLMLGLVAKRPNSARLFETIIGMFAALLAITSSWLLGPFSTQTATLAGIIILLPGLTLTVAMNELATRDLVSGSARLIGAFMVLLALGFGVAIGFELGRFIPGTDAPLTYVSIPIWLELIVLIASTIALSVLFQAKPRDLLAMLLAAALGLYGARLGAHLISPQLGASLGAFLVAAMSNLFSRWTNRPAAVTLMPGIILLVPGSLGFRSFASLLDQNILSGVESAFNVVLVGVSIVVGLLLANVAVPVRKEL
ncbi:MAG: threonine/serine exporter family protein [Planctomycetota bacterium]|nr:threonine/serine exporter family protein [Planctomycetota bacterium]